MNPLYLDALVVGAGFGGIYQLYSLLKLGLNVKAIEKGENVGGVWHWNRYPGTRTDTESHLYRFSWDKDALQTDPWANNYLSGDEVRSYLNSVVDKHNLRPHFHFSTEMISAEWDEPQRKWRVETNTGQVFITTYLFTALGMHTIPNIPAIPGLDTFQGPVMHSSAWDPAVDITDKRVAVLGSGSSGIQISTAIAPAVSELHCLIRNPQFSVPLRLEPVAPARRAQINRAYDDIWATQRASRNAFGFAEPAVRATDVTPAERRRVFEELWARGNGFRFVAGGFADVASDAAANAEACAFLRGKIAAVVRDPAKAAVLTPREMFARRPPCDEGYYDIFNRGNVFAVDVSATPIVAVEGGGVRTADGRLHEVDVIVLATGFRSGDGSYLGLRGPIRGRGGALLSDHWAASGIKTYLGLFVSSFPNLFLVNGPQVPYSNVPVSIEAEVDFLTTMLAEVGRGGKADAVIECTPEAEGDYADLCHQLSLSETLVNKVDSWLTGKNTPGAKNSTLFYYGGLKSYRDLLLTVKEDMYRGLTVLT
ncbi:hypothetical protein DHEL01_v210583 [Diaporthe helianthi]|uniref:Cyclohexanone monooxygenase n=1 Tax=Diaporthe helianthi TaxID=158607 RepID=A0A2P5HL97_DIAHE|nr:hypothetical protein DHEL01_v210583 [Diaporthe helianthi]